jgi:hypothetical protein
MGTPTWKNFGGDISFNSFVSFVGLSRLSFKRAVYGMRGTGKGKGREGKGRERR